MSLLAPNHGLLHRIISLLGDYPGSDRQFPGPHSVSCVAHRDRCILRDHLTHRHRVLGKQIPGVIGATSYENIREHIATVLSGKAVEFEVQISSPQDRKRFKHASYVPDRDQHGNVRGLVGAITDITASKKIEELLRQREGQLQLLIDTAPLGIYIVDAGMRIRQVNPTARPFFGEIEDVVGRDLSDVVRLLWQPGYAAEMLKHFDHTLESGEPYVVEESAEERRDRGVTEYYRWQLNRITLPDGQAGVVCYFIDISASVLPRQALARSEELFRTLAENISQLAWMMDATGWIFWYNQRWYEFTGTTLEQMQGWGWMAVHHPDHVGRVVEQFRESIEKGEDWEDTFPLRGKDGEYRWFLSRAHPIRAADGRILRWFGTYTDVTLQLTTQEALRRANQDLEHLPTPPATISRNH